MARVLATVSESNQQPPTDLSQPSRRYGRYLEKIRSLSVVSAGGSSSSSSRTARSSEYSGSMSSGESGGSQSQHRRYAPCSESSFLRVGFQVHCPRDIAKQMVRDGFVLNLIGEFSRGREGAGPPVLERWFSELDVGWVLRSSAPEKELADEGLHGLAARRWMRGFAVMAHALAATHRHLHEERSTAEGPAVAMESPAAAAAAQDSEHDELLQDDNDDDDLRLARFAEASVTRMLAFADGALLVAAGNTWRRAMDKLSQLMDLHSCISDVSEILMTCLEQEAGRLVDSAEMQSLFNKTNDVFSSTSGNLARAIWRMAKDAEAVTPVLSGMDSCEIFPQNTEIHKDTRLIVDYARLFWEYQSVLEDVLRSYYSNDDPEDQTQYFTALIAQMITNLEQHLEKKSESFSDSSLRYMFLLNNSHFIQDQFIASTEYSLAWKAGLKHEQYQESYMLVSWEHVLYCLHDKMPLWFPKHSSPVARFKSEFQKTCRHQKLWKVPNPKLRKSLREDIIDKVINGYKRYLADHPDQEKCSSDQHDMENMVNELFEG